MSMWNILEIEATSDLSTIKKAYARKLKVHHPEEDPQGFQSLKEAYDNAVRYAKYRSRQTVYAPENGWDYEESEYDEVRQEKTSNPEENGPFPGNPSDGPSDAPSEILPPEPFSRREAANQEFVNQLDLLYSDFFERIKLENWTELLNREAMWDIENRCRLEPMVVGYLSAHYRLPQSIWKLLDRSFNLQEREKELYREYDTSFVRHVMNVLKQPIPLNYSFVKEVAGRQYDRYLELKDKTLELLEENPRTAESTLEQARALCPKDPDLTRMEGIIRYQTGKFDPALQLFGQALLLNPNDMEALYYRALISFVRCRYKSALEDLDKVRSAYPDHLPSLWLSAKCCHELKASFRAKDLIERAYLLEPGGEKVKYAREQIDRRLKGKLWFRLFIQPWKFRQTTQTLLALYKFSEKRVTSKTILYILAVIAKWLLYLLIALLALAIAYVTKIGILILIFYLIKHFSDKEK